MKRSVEAVLLLGCLAMLALAPRSASACWDCDGTDCYWQFFGSSVCIEHYWSSVGWHTCTAEGSGCTFFDPGFTGPPAPEPPKDPELASLTLEQVYLLCKADPEHFRIHASPETIAHLERATSRWGQLAVAYR